MSKNSDKFKKEKEYLVGAIGTRKSEKIKEALKIVTDLEVINSAFEQVLNSREVRKRNTITVKDLEALLDHVTDQTLIRRALRQEIDTYSEDGVKRLLERSSQETINNAFLAAHSEGTWAAKENIRNILVKKVDDPEIINSAFKNALDYKQKKKRDLIYIKSLGGLIEKVTDQGLLDLAFVQAVRSNNIEETYILRSTASQEIINKEFIGSFEALSKMKPKMAKVLLEKVNDLDVLNKAQSFALENKENKNKKEFIKQLNHTLEEKIKVAKEAQSSTLQGKLDEQQEGKIFINPQTSVVLDHKIVSLEPKNILNAQHNLINLQSNIALEQNSNNHLNHNNQAQYGKNLNKPVSFMTDDYSIGTAMLILSILKLSGMFKNIKFNIPPRIELSNKVAPTQEEKFSFDSYFKENPKAAFIANQAYEYITLENKNTWNQQDITNFVRSDKFQSLAKAAELAEKESRKLTPQDIGVCSKEDNYNQAPNRRRDSSQKNK